MRSVILSFFALVSAVIVTETDYRTFYVTLQGPAPLTSSTESSSPTSTAVPIISVATSGSPSAIEKLRFTYITPDNSMVATTSPVSEVFTSISESIVSSSSTSSSSSELILYTSSSTSSSISSPTPSSDSLTAFQKDILNYHNRVRAKHHVGPLVWNNTLAEYAQNYLDHNNCVFEHSGGPYGENLAIGFASTDAAQNAWYIEKKFYDYKAGQFGEDTGHFTQMVWKGSHQIGCATRDCSGRTYLACEYYPYGNIIGYFTENVFPEN